MSTGAFILSKYEANNGTIHPVRIQPETIIPDVNPAPEAAVGAGTLLAKVNKGIREYGLGCRGVYVKWTGAAAEGYVDYGIYRIPILTRTAYDGLQIGSKFNYQGAEVEVIGLSAERRR